MKKIFSESRREEILKRKAEYEQKKKEFDARDADRRRRYYQAEKDAFAPIREELEGNLKWFKPLDFEIRVENYYRSGLQVRISCNERNKFDGDVALSWSYEVSLSETGEIQRESSSWSGLKATTEGQMKSLRQTVRALEYLNDVDWKQLLDITIPQYSDFIDYTDVPPTAEDFKSQLREADLEDLVGADKIVLINNFESSGYRSPTVWVKILRETPSQYQVIIIPHYIVNNDGAAEFLNPDTHPVATYSQRVKKSNVYPVYENDEMVTKDIR